MDLKTTTAIHMCLPRKTSYHEFSIRLIIHLCVGGLALFIILDIPCSLVVWCTWYVMISIVAISQRY
jgi:hypothetical protein